MRSGTISLFVAAGLLLACNQPPTAANDADPAAASLSNGAVVIHGGECGVIDGTGAFFWGSCTTEVATPSQNGNASVNSHASGVPNPTGETVFWGPDNPGWEWEELFALYFGIEEAPYPCAVLGPDGELLFTLKWSAKVTPSGQGSMSCHFGKKWEYQWP